VEAHCFAGCDWRAVKTTLRERRLLVDERPGSEAIVELDSETLRAEAKRRQRKIAAARAIWRVTQTAEETLAARYLLTRGIATVPRSIRYHPSLRHSESNLCLPTMVAGVQTVNGEFTGIHRTFLSNRGKASVSQPKMMLGPCAGGAVRLAPLGPELILGEGIETTLSVVHAMGGAPGWACLSTSGLRSVQLPAEVRSVVILEDGDDPGREAAAALTKRLLHEGRVVHVARTPSGIKDFNDLLLAGAA
jgi:hypothetical protein